MAKKIIILFSFFFVSLSFYPTLYEINQAKNLPTDRAFELVHNYVFDYNFYLSRIREGQPAFVPFDSGLRRGEEGQWLVTEKYYNRPHAPSFFQIVYLYMGKLGSVIGLMPPAVYHAARLLMGLMLLMVIGRLVQNIFSGWWQVVAYLFVVTGSSWPILVKLADNTYRFSAHWGGWSVIDPLQRITFIPHVLIGQIFLVLFVGVLSDKLLKLPRLLKWGIAGLVAGIIFPPVLITIYMILVVQTAIEMIISKSLKLPKLLKERAIFIALSFPALLYAQVMFHVAPWSALAIFDIEHRSILPFGEYLLALGPMLPLGLLGGLAVLAKMGGLGKLGEIEKRMIPFVSWILALGFLFLIFEHVPQQSPTRFTQMLLNVPLGILATYFLQKLWETGKKIKIITVIIVITIILTGMGVMTSSLFWATDQVVAKRAGTWFYPVGTQLVYPLKDFMSGIDYLRLNTKTRDMVLAYEAAGNYIPAYAGNYVYLGHANTPDEDTKLQIAAKFFKGEMTEDEAKQFLSRENIKYIYFGPQERELSDTVDLKKVYSFLFPIYANRQVLIYKFSI